MNAVVYIDVNADVGEGLDNESRLMPYLSSCNVACGGHAGDADTMEKTVRLARQNNLKIGAHPSYPDRANFGRVPMVISSDDLLETVSRQVEALFAIVKEQGGILHHIKPHGALYHVAARDRQVATLITSLVEQFNPQLKLYVPYGSIIEKVAKQKFVPIVYEAFIDRRYHNDRSLVSRKEKEAVITDPQAAFDQVYGVIKRQELKTVDGTRVSMLAETFCIHGDNSNAEMILKELTGQFERHNIKVR